MVGYHEHSNEVSVSVKGRKLARLAKQLLLAFQVNLSISGSKSASILTEEVKNWYIAHKE